MNENNQERIDAYLDGLLSEDETARFERDLLDEELSTAFREALLMRELLGHLPPDQPPAHLVERIESAILRDKNVAETGRDESKIRFGRIRGAVKATLGWSEYAWHGISDSSSTMKKSFSGMQTLGYLLGPLQDPARQRINAIVHPKKPLWKTALSKLW